MDPRRQSFLAIVSFPSAPLTASGSLCWWTVGASVNSCRWAFGQLSNYRKPGTDHTLICWSGGLICALLEVVLQSKIQQCEVWWAWEKGGCRVWVIWGPQPTASILGIFSNTTVHPQSQVMIPVSMSNQEEKEAWALWPAWRRQEVLLPLNDSILTCRGRMLPSPCCHGALRLRECHQSLRLFLLVFSGKT